MNTPSLICLPNPGNDVIASARTTPVCPETARRELMAMVLPEVPLFGSSVALRGHRPMQMEMAYAPDAVKELPKVSDWEARFGITAPSASELGDRLTQAMDWTRVRKDLEKVMTYVKSKEGTCWRDALQTVEEMKAPFELAAKADPERMKDLAALAHLLRAQKEVGKRAAATRARRVKAKRDSDAALVAALPPTPREEKT